MIDKILRYFNIQTLIVIILGFVVVYSTASGSIDSEGSMFALGALAGYLTQMLNTTEKGDDK